MNYPNYPYKFHFDRIWVTTQFSIRDWLKENIGEEKIGNYPGLWVEKEKYKLRFQIVYVEYCFKHEEDALLFALRWVS